MSIVYSLDITFTNWINSLIPHNQYFDLLFSFFSLRGGSIIVWIIIVAALVFFEEKIDKRFMWYFAITIILSFIIPYGLKQIVQRPRPTFVVNHQIKTCDKDFSLPSGHATTAFAAAVILASFDKKRRYAYFFIAVLISVSRIYLQCHYLLDVMSGAAIGTLCSFIVLRLKSRNVKIFS